MATEVFMPKLSMTMEVGTIVQWFKEEGDSIEAGEPLLEVLTDKIAIEVEAYVSGVLLKRYYGNDAVVPVNSVIGYIGEAGENVPDEPPAAGGTQQEKETVEAVAEGEQASEEKHPDAAQGPVRATPAARKAARDAGIRLADVVGTGPNGRIQRDDVLKLTAQNASADPETGPKATPLARKIAAAEQIDLGQISGTGANGKIVRADLPLSSEAAAPAMQKFEGVRKIIGQRMAQSAFTAPHVTLHSEVDMNEAVKLRTKLLPLVEQATGLRLSYMELIVKAVALALRKHPDINVSLDGDYIRFHQDVHIGMAVAREEGLIVPVIRNADKKRLTELVETCKSLAKLARENKLAADQITGGTFTISNLGMYAVDAFTPIINQPESAILGVGRITEKAVGVNGAIELRPMMALSLSFDHRVIDGAPAAAFLTSLKKILENPYELLL
ncbi:MAG TPA: dihydrolipoamide acetyltransferase family protein [Bacilli bacterium]